MIRREIALLALLATGTALPAMAQADDAAAKFGALEAVRQISLSPDGTKVAYIAPKPDGGQVVVVAPLDGSGAPKAILANSVPRERLRACRWITETRLVCRLSGRVEYGNDLLPYARSLAVDSDGQHRAELMPRTSDRATAITLDGGAVIDDNVPGKPGHVLFARTFVPEDGSAVEGGSNIARRDEGYGVEDLDVVSLKRTVVERANREAAEYISDGWGNIRVMGLSPTNSDDRLIGRTKYRFRKKGDREWNDLGQVTFTSQTVESGFEPVAVDSDKDVVYGFEGVDGRKALVSVALDGSSKRQVVLARPDVDVDELVRIGRSDRVVGASYATERRVVDFFDPELSKLFAALSAALPGHPQVTAIDASADEGKLLLSATSDVDPGAFYLFDKKTRQLGEVMPVRPELKGLAMGAMKPITFTAADGTRIPGYLTLPPGSSGKNLPAIVMPHGGPTARDEWGFDWLVQYYATRGYAVLQPNFRGSTGYGSDYFQKNGYQSWRTAIGDVNDAGRWLVAQGIANPARLAIVGWSYGGYAALQSSVLDPKLFKAIVAVAPVTDLQHLKDEGRFSSYLKVRRDFIGDRPHIVEGSPARNVEKFQAPVLMFHGDKDLNVNVEESKFMAGRLRGAGKSVELVIFPGLDHQLPSADARTRLLAQSDAFQRKTLGL